ncbi:MAG: NAD-dependent epimerase/dehydratase family protein [Synoicihabitans sp.]
MIFRFRPSAERVSLSTYMKILITGICGFVGSTLARGLVAHGGHELIGLDNFIRPGSESNRDALKQLGIPLFHGDIRSASDLETLPTVDWVIDAAANPSVLAGVDGKSSSRQLVEHNLNGTVNMLELCKTHSAGFTLLSTSRVYSIPPLANLPVEIHRGAFRPNLAAELPLGVSVQGVKEDFSTLAPVSLYGATKLASESLALEYGATFDFPVFINRCGVMAGAGQFGRPDQGIFAYWINSHLRRRALKYIGFDGQGHQVRDCLHPADLLPLLELQFEAGKMEAADRVINVSGGAPSAMSLKQLTAWCNEQFGEHDVATEPTPRPFDIPWVVLDSSKAESIWNWRPTTSTLAILQEIAAHARENADWLDRSAPF